MVRQKRRVQHLRVGQDDIRTLPDPAPLRLHRIPVIDPCRNPPFSKIFKERLKRPVLVCGERFRRIDEDRPGKGLFQYRLQHWKQKAQCLSARGGRGDHHILPALRFLKHLSLMGIEPGNVMRDQV